MKAIPDKCHFICSSNCEVRLMVENELIKDSRCEGKLLDVKIDSKLTCLFLQQKQKLNAISRITPYMDFTKKRRQKVAINKYIFLFSVQ